MDERAAPVCSQIRQKHWNCIYRSSVSIRYENPTALGSGSRAAAHGNNFGRDEGVRQQGIKGIGIERERERRDGFVLFSLRHRSFGTVLCPGRVGTW